jgi:hypothetical protein
MAHLTWAPSVLEEARRLKTHLAGERELICLHLKNQSGGPEESNASFDEWERFLSRPEVISDHTYLVLGDDRLPEDLLARPHVTAARSLGVSLGVQLALVTIANGFIGMASGIAQAAVFSPSPYAIFKHPRHHVAEMVRELGEGDRFPLAGPHQRLIRQPDTEANLFVAWQTLITAARCAP